jgi:hypothetical protein
MEKYMASSNVCDQDDILLLLAWSLSAVVRTSLLQAPQLYFLDWPHKPPVRPQPMQASGTISTLI